MKALLRRFKADESGATAIEYGLIAAFIALAIVLALTNIGPKLTSIFNNIDTNLTGASTQGTTPPA